MQSYYNPFTIRSLDNGWKCLIVKVKKVVQHPSVNDLLVKKFGSFNIFNTIPKSKLYFCHQDNKLNLYQISLNHGVCTIHILRLFDETRIEADIDSIITSIRESVTIPSYITLSVYMYLPYMFNVDVMSLMKVFRSNGQKDNDIYGNTLHNRTKLYTCKWPLKHTVSTLASSSHDAPQTVVQPAVNTNTQTQQTPVTTTAPPQPQTAQQPTSLFGNTQTTFPPSLFGNTTTTTTNTTQPLFGSTSTTTTAQPPPVFGTTATTTTVQPSIFGTTNTTQPLFGSTSTTTATPAIFNTGMPAFTIGTTQPAKK